MVSFNKKMFKRLVIFLMFTIVTACSSTTYELPAWVAGPEHDNIESIYGIGEGLTLDTAKQSALENIASKFSIKVASTTSHRQTLHNDRSDDLFQQDINTSVKDIELTQYKLLKTENINHLYYVHISISRTEFVLDKKTKLHSLIKNIDLELKDITEKNKVDQLYRYNKVLVLIAKAEPLVHLLTVTDSAFKSDKYMSMFRQHIESEKVLLAKTRFFVRSTKKLNSIAQLIKDSLETQGFQLSNSKHADGIIDIKGTIKNTTNFSTKNTRINFDVLVKSRGGQVYKKSMYQINGASISSYSSAQEIATINFSKQIKSKLDIYKMFGFN